MNYKKTSKEGGINRLYNELDKVVKLGDDALEARAAQVEVYASDLTKLIDDGKSTTTDILQSLDEILEPGAKKALMDKMSVKFDLPESLDENIYDYVKSCQVDELKAVKFLQDQDELTDEDCVILVDDILSAYE